MSSKILLYPGSECCRRWASTVGICESIPYNALQISKFKRNAPHYKMRAVNLLTLTRQASIT